MDILKDFLKGLVIGIGGVAPGVSGGTFAVMLGVYDQIMDTIANLFENFPQKIKDIFPLALGVGVGIIVFARIIQYLFGSYETYVSFLFIGLMIGSLPAVFKEANKGGFRKTYLIPLIVTFSLALIFNFFNQGNFSQESNYSYGILNLIAFGLILSFGTIVPGVSSSFILMYFGVYSFLLDAFISLNLRILIPLALGFAIGIFIFAKIVNFFFDLDYGRTYYGIIGFVIASIVSIVPSPSDTPSLLLSLVIAFVGVVITYMMGKIRN